MVEKFEIKNLWGKQDYQFDFHKDLNILTGDNGSGKTTILKLMWYMLSGHIKLALSEVVFDEAVLTTEIATITLIQRNIKRTDKHPRDNSSLFGREDKVGEIHMKKKNGQDIFSLWPIPMRELAFLVNDEGPSMAMNTLFLPTYRRMELNLGETKIIEGFKDYSKKMSHQLHQMIAFADYTDIEHITNKKFTNIKERLKPDEEKFTDFIKKGSLSADAKFTKSLINEVEKIEKARELANRPLTLLSKYIDQFFLDKRVQITEELILGTRLKAPAIWLKDLSAGEKNFLSFLIYAMEFSNQSIMFIDEPELTLHIDWQRSLLTILKEIAPKTQFFVVTHSPAIVASFPEKDFWLNEIGSKK
jgi:predicted ATPase